eukprot:TRINITY_DN18359_c0_g1_i1.p1 TRINITY_DN18359_c0_g1~~TRINITY_DN18359_c0_g1_i1.p1  ORF type:complete len:505 (+),score=229.52 TRINITY_DN18359_c0_g1_i1:47-1516(+)
MVLNRRKIRDLQSKVRGVAELKTRYGTAVKLPKGLWRMTAELVEAEVGLPWVSEGRVEVGKETVNYPGKLDSEEGDFDVRVLLFNGPAVATRFYQYKASIILARREGRDQLYGGAHDPSIDGEATDHETLVKTAVRHLKQQSGLDLSSIPPASWVRFATFEQKKEDPEEQIPTTTVVLLPLLWNHPGTYIVSRVQQEIEEEIVKKVKKEVEEEVEVEVDVERELPGQEGEMDEDRKTEIVKEIQTKIEKKIVEEDVTTTNVVVKYWGCPYSMIVADGLRNPPASWELAFVVELLAEWIIQEAGTIITSALQDHRSAKLVQQERKRKREEYKEALETRKKAKKESRAQALKDKFEEMEARWKDEDEGKTDEELQECKAEREQEKEAVTKEMQEQWAAEDLAEVPEPSVDDEPMDDTAVNEDALAAFSIFDANLSTYGASPSEYISNTRLQELLQSCVNTPTSPATVMELIKSAADGQAQLKYRTLTDVTA